MKKINFLTSSRIHIVLGAALMVFFLAGPNNASAFTPLSGQINAGTRSTDVSNLQAFLASNSNIYPSGLVTGYYGPMTAQALEQFQIAYGISPANRVGPQTLAKINSLISSGNNLDLTAPVITVNPVNTTANGATFNVVTNEPARIKVYYGTSTLTPSESQMGFTEPIIGNSTLAPYNPISNTSQNVVVENSLQASSNYNYMVQAVDNAGNVSITWPSVFRTMQ